MTAFERLRAKLPGVSPEKLEALYLDAMGTVLALTGRQTLPRQLETAAVQLAIVLYNREGIEGETAHSEGGVARTMEAIPQEIMRQIMPYRLARIVKVSG